MTTILKEFVFKNSQIFAQCHASTLVELDDGGFLAAWFGGTREGADDVAIWGARRIGNAWSPPERWMKLRDAPHWNPVLFKNLDGRVHLFFKVGRSIKAWESYVTTSNDHGETWSEPREVVPGDHGGRGPVKNKPIILSDGSWLAPGSVENDGWSLLIDRSVDGGKTWAATPQFGDGVIQPSLWESTPGRVHLLARSSRGRIFRSDSEDFGKTWSDPFDTGLPNNNSGIDVAKLADGSLALVHNPVAPASGRSWGPRTPLALSISSDNGETWATTRLLEDEPAVGDDQSKWPEFSYPSIIKTANGAAFVHTWKRRRIVFGLIFEKPQSKND